MDGEVNRMLIEHTFVTTLEPKKVFEQVHALLHSAGFLIGIGSLDHMNSGKASMEMTRGLGRNIDPKRCHQRVQIELDRGRVTVAASIKPAQRGGGFRLSSNSSGPEPKPTSTWGKPYADLMIALAQSLENLLAKGQSPAEASQPWFQLEDQISQRAEKMRRNGRVTAIVVSAVIGFLIFFLVASANTHTHLR